jgi:hypothetical protein
MIFAPSIGAHVLNGLLMLLALILTVINYSKLQALDSFRLIGIVLLFSIAVGIHGLSHLGLEAKYGLNPFDRQV